MLRRMSDPLAAFPANGPGDRPAAYREVTIASIVYGVIFGGIMNAAITYAGLKIGFTLSGSAIAAVLGFGILRGVLRKGSILETNIGQTIASTVNTTNAGIIFTIPVLLLIDGALGRPGRAALSFGDPTFWWITLAGTAGALLGCVFIVPLRKQMLDIERLRFPSAVAVASILKSPGAGSAKAIVLVVGTVVGALLFLPTALPQLGGMGYGSLGIRGVTDDRINIGMILGLPAQMPLVFAIAPFAIGAGYLTGAPGLLVLAGGILAYLVLTPLAYNLGWMPEVTEDFGAAGYAQIAFNRPLGIGLLLGGALMGVLASLPAVREGLKVMLAAGRTRRDDAGVPIDGGPASDEMGWKSLLGISLFAVVLLLVAVEMIGRVAGDVGGVLGGLHPWLARGVLVLVAVGWIWFAGIIISQCSGMTDWSPISGLSLLTVVLVMFLSGTSAVLPAVVLGAALCVAISCAADMMGDLKTGYLLGAVPRGQQVTQVFTAALGPLITMATLVLITQANVKQFGVPIGPGTDTTAPQAVALQAVIQGVQGGSMPYALYAMGGILGILLGIGLFPGLGVLVGLSMYLPVDNIFTYGIGCLLNIAVAKVKGRDWAEEWGVPFCAGLVVGEAVLQLIINSIVLLRG